MVDNRTRRGTMAACERDRRKARRKLILRIVELTDALRRLELDSVEAENVGVLTGVEASNLIAAATTARTELSDWRPPVRR